jgi:hypothetical protein
MKDWEDKAVYVLPTVTLIFIIYLSQPIFSWDGFKDFVAIFSAVATVVIAIVAAYIAHKQTETGKRQLKIDTFDKRFEVFDATRIFLSQVLGGNIEREQLFAFIQKKQTSSFIFGDDINKYLDEIYEKAVRYYGITKKMRAASPSNKDYFDLMEKNDDLMDWFLKQDKIMRDKFSVYLKLDID